MKFFSATFLILISLLFVACGNSEGTKNEAVTTTDTTITSGEVNNPAKPKGARHNFKSGIITFKSKVMMMEQDGQIFFDDWGAKHRNEINFSFMGKNVKNYSIRNNGDTYSWDPEKKTGTIIPFDTSSINNVNFTTLNDDIKMAYQIKDEGTALVLNRQCRIYSMKNKEQGIEGKYYIWNGITLKAVGTANGTEINVEAVKIEENAIIPAEKFIVPTDVKFTNSTPKV